MTLARVKPAIQITFGKNCTTHPNVSKTTSTNITFPVILSKVNEHYGLNAAPFYI